MDSLVSQTSKAFEIAAVDVCSDDETLEMLSAYPPIRVVVRKRVIWLMQGILEFIGPRVVSGVLGF